ncbi:hypothetical protein ACFQ0I_15135 [Mariniflexile aquimaris]|uniref:Uncharacterized protein n=1 Tax=Mariniflexile aquimaris TaxID=881009 RepID=A0ABW3BXS5_9FLAO
MDIEEIRTKIAMKQIELNNEKDQEKKNELLQDLKVLNMRKDMEETNSKIQDIRKSH